MPPPLASWTRGNNCPPEQKASKNGTVIHSIPSEMTVPAAEIWPPDLDKATRQERRDILRRIRSETTPPKPVKKAAYAPEDSQKVAEIYDFAQSLGWRDSNLMLWARHLAAGGELSISGERYYSRNDGQIYSKKEPEITTNQESEHAARTHEILARFNNIRKGQKNEKI